MSAKSQRTVPVGEHPLPERHAYPHDIRLLVLVTVLFFIALPVIGVVVYEQPKDSSVAMQKAAQLQELLKRSGLPVPSQSVIAKSLGTDGGVVGKMSGVALPAAILNQQLTAGGGGVGARPIPIAQDVLNTQLAIIDVYCPSKAAAFMKYFRKYKVYDVIKE